MADAMWKLRIWDSLVEVALILLFCHAVGAGL